MRRASKTMHERARALRQTLTPSERRVWKWLRNRAFCGYKFRRQFPVDRYVLDFYCPELRLAFEIDGEHHGSWGVAECDEERSRRLEMLGVRVARMANVVVATDVRLAEDLLRYWIDQRLMELGK